MKLTKLQLRQIIREEIQSLKKEDWTSYEAAQDLKQLQRDAENAWYSPENKQHAKNLIKISKDLDDFFDKFHKYMKKHDINNSDDKDAILAHGLEHYRSIDKEKFSDWMHTSYKK